MVFWQLRRPATIGFFLSCLHKRILYAVANHVYFRIIPTLFQHLPHKLRWNMDVAELIVMPVAEAAITALLYPLDFSESHRRPHIFGLDMESSRVGLS